MTYLKIGGRYIHTSTQQHLEDVDAIPVRIVYSGFVQLGKSERKKMRVIRIFIFTPRAFCGRLSSEETDFKGQAILLSIWIFEFLTHFASFLIL